MTTSTSSDMPKPAGADLPDRLWAEAPAVAALGNAPLRLAAGGVWRVAAGRVEVFACREDAGGARVHLATAGPGGLIFGAEARGLSLLAVGSRDSRLVDVGHEGVRRAAAEPAQAVLLAPLLEEWISRLLGESLGAAPKAFVELRAGVELLGAVPRG